MTNPDFNDGRDQEPAVATPPEPISEPQTVTADQDPADATHADLVALLKKAEDEAIAMKDAWLRARADVENVRRQSQAEVSKAHKYGIEKFAEMLLPVKDALEQTLAAQNASPEALREGVELTLKQLNSAFEKSQLSAIDPVGEKFDPHLHQAMSMVPSEQPANTVVQVMQKGYRLADRVLRPALVAVSQPRG